MKNYVVVLERKGKQAIVVMRDSDYHASITTDRGNNPKMRYGSGARWNVLNVMDQEAYNNQTDSTPF